MGDWAVVRRDQHGSAIDTVSDLSMDAAFGLMMNMAGFRWSIRGRDEGGFQLDIARTLPRNRPPIGDPFTITELSAPILSSRENRRIAEREIKLEVLFRGCDGIEAQYAPPLNGDGAFLDFIGEWVANSGRAQLQPNEDFPDDF